MQHMRTTSKFIHTYITFHCMQEHTYTCTNPYTYAHTYMLTHMYTHTQTRTEHTSTPPHPHGHPWHAYPRFIRTNIELHGYALHAHTHTCIHMYLCATAHVSKKHSVGNMAAAFANELAVGCEWVIPPFRYWSDPCWQSFLIRKCFQVDAEHFFFRTFNFLPKTL